MYEGFDWKGYLAYTGYPEDQIPESVTDEELAQIRDHWARTVYQEELAIAAQDPFLETKKEREEQARDRLLALAPEYRQSFGLKEEQPAEAAFSADDFREHVVNNPVQDAPLDYYLKTFAAKRIGKNTKYEYPYLEGLTKKDFEDLFMERNGIDPDLTTIEDIRNGNFGPVWMAQRAEEESNLPKGSAMRQGWLTFKKLTGLTTETFGDALGIEWMQNIGKGITENAINTIEEEGYKSKYGESLVDTFKAQGPFAAAGKVLEMAQENWATTGVPLALAGMSALFGIAARNPRLAAQGLAGARASLAAATSADVAMGTGVAATVGRVGASTIAKSLAFASALASGLEVGAVREELEEKSKEEGRQLYDPNDPGDVVAWGLLSAALDHVGNMMTFVGGGGLVRAAKGLVQSQQTRMLEAAEAAIRQAGKEAGKSWGRKIVEAMGTEGITEALQELPGIMAAKNKGVEYDVKEIRDRMIDAGVVGAFMGGGMRSVQALTERKPRTQSESDTTTPQQQTQTPPTNVPPAPNQPPPPGFNVASNTNYAEIEGGWAAWDGYNTGYGNTKEEASQAIIDQSNKNKDTIDPANVTSTANESRVSFGNGGEIVVTGNGHKKVIGDIISLHNANDNVVNFDGTKTHNFDATTLSGLSAEALRNRIEHSGKTAISDIRSVRKARADQVDIAINYSGEKRDSSGNLIGYRAELVLDDATRNQLAAKGYRILGSQFNNDVQTVQLYRDGQIYRIELTTNGNEVASTLFTKKILGNLNARVESELSTQKHRITDVGGAAKEVQNFLSVSPAVRSGGIQIERTGAGADAKFVNRKGLENFVKKQGGKVVKSTDRSITYELGGETLRLDLQANGDVVVSRDGRFLGAYQFDGSDLGNGMERATYDLTNDVAPVTRFSAQDVYEGLGYRRASNRSQNVLFVKDNESGDYYVIKVGNKGKVDVVLVPYDPNGFFARLEALNSMRTIEDVRQVYQDQFRSGYVEFVDFGGGNLGMRSRTTGLMTDDINDVQILTSDEVDDIINNPANPNYNPRLMENLVKVIGISQYTSSTSTTPARIVDWVTVDDVAGVQAFIERAKGYGAIIADYDSTGNNISVKGKAWNAPGSFNADAAGLGLTDLYEEDYLNFDPDVHIDYLLNEGTPEAIEEIKKDIDKVRKATRKIFTDIDDLLTRTNSPFYSQHITKADIDIIKSALDSTNKISNSPDRIGIKAKRMRRHFYRARLLQAKLHIDTLLVNYFPNRIDIDSEVNRLQAYDPNWSNDEVRFAAAEAEEIALRLEEEFLNLREMQVSTSLTRRIWDSIYPGNSGVEYGSFIERIHNQGNDFRFSRDVNAPRAERHMSLLDELRNHPFIGNGALSDLIDSGKLILLETQQEIEDALLREGQAVPKFDQLGNIQGFASNDNMRVYLSSWGIKQGDAFRVLLHEMSAHTRRFGFSEAEFQEILSGIKANSTAQTPEGRHIRHAMWRAQNAKVSPNDPHYWEEVAAYLVEGSNEYAGLGMLDTMQAWVKRWLFTNGYIDATNFHYQDFTIFSLGMLRDSRIPLRLLNGKFDYSRHQNRIYDTRKFVESYVTEDIAKQLGYSREEVIEMVAAHLAGTYKSGNHVIGDLPDEDELMSYFPTLDEDARGEGLRYSLIDINAAKRLDIFNDVTTRLNELGLAQHMEDMGATEKEIKFATNWTRGNDGIWKYEISDKWMKFDIPVLRGRKEKYKELKSNITKTRKMIKSRDSYEQYLDAKEELIKFYIDLTRGIVDTDDIGGIYTSIDNIITHKELFIAYPDLRLNRFEFVDDMNDEDSYGWIENDGTLKVNVGSIIRDATSVKEIEETIKNTIIHEVQHLIQRISGFARGGSPEIFETLEQKRKEKQVIEVLKYAYKSLEEFRNIFFSDDNISLFLKDNPQLSEKEIEELRKTIEDKFPRSSYPIHLRDEVGDLFYNYLKNDNPKIDELWESITKDLNNFKMLNRVYSDNSVSKYRKLLGEIEARVVEHRRKFSEEELRKISISSTEILEGIYSKEDMIDPDSLLPLAYKEGKANLGFAIRRNFSESKVEADWRAFDRDDSASDLRFSRDMETAIAEARDEVLRPHLPPAGVQKDASVIYPNMGEEISNFRYSIGKKAREEYRAQLERGREDLSPDEIENILKELDKYHDAKQFKKVKAALHWTITGRVILPEDEYKVDDAIELAENKGIDLISNLKKYESPLDFVNEYLESRPEGAPIRPEQLKERFPGIFTAFENHGDGIVSYQVQDSKEGQQAMREIINTHLGKDQSPWCLLYANTHGELNEGTWETWRSYNGLPKRVAFKNGNLISFMAVHPIRLPFDNLINAKRYVRSLYQIEDSEYLFPSFYEKFKKIDNLRETSQYMIDVAVNSLKSEYAKDEGKRWSNRIFNRSVFDLPGFDDFLMLVPQDIREKIEEFRNGNEDILDIREYANKLINYAAKQREIAEKTIENNLQKEWTRFLMKNIKELEIKDEIFILKPDGRILTFNDVLKNGNGTNIKFYSLGNDYFIPDTSMIIPDELWWDIDDESHPNLEWAKVDPEVGRIRFSIAGEIGAARLDALEEVTTHMDNLVVAREMRKKRKKPSIIKLATGWEYGKDKKWRYEIDDSNISLITPTTNNDWKDINRGQFNIGIPFNYNGIDRSFAKLEEVINHKELFNAYPELKKVDIKVSFVTSRLFGDDIQPGEVEGGVIKRPGGNYEITINTHYSTSNENILSYIIHEIQHVIQDIEGFAQGSSPEEQGSEEEYFRVAGEVEAYNVQKRLRWNIEKRLNTLLSESEDVAREDQIILRKKMEEIPKGYYAFTLPTTPEQGTAIPNAPGMYKMRNGTIQAHPEYIPPGLETETAIYAAVAISDIAKNEPGLEDVRAMINADEVLREEVLAELSQRGIEDTRDNEFLYAIRNVLQTREPEDPTYQAIVDVFHDAITKATGGIQDDILLTDSDIAAAAHAITDTPFEPLIGEPVPTVPTPKPTVFDQMEANWAMMQSTIDEAVANTEVSERETPIIRYSIAGVDMRLDGVEGYNGVDGRQKLYAELEQIYGSTHQWNEWDSFYNQLAAAQITGTREVRDVGALAAPADSNRGLVDQFLNAALPDYLKDKIQIEWTMTPDAVKNLNGGLASFDPRGGAADKLIYIQGWGRTVGQVIRSAAWELSRFGWNAAPGAMTNLKKPLVELYNLHESAIYQELSPYYTKYKINRANVSDKHKIFLVQTYFAKMNQDILTGNPNALAQQIGIDPATYKRIHDEIVQNVNTATTDLKNYIENYAAISTDPEIAKAFTQDILRLIMGGMHGRGAAFVYETANSAGPSDTIYCYTNDFGLHRKFLKPECDDGKNRYACIANEIKENIEWWRKTFEPWGIGDLAAGFCRFFLRNFPMHNGLSFLHLNVPSAHLGDTTITKATSLISRIWQRVDDPHGIEVRNNLKVMERIHAILRDHNYDARWTENATNGYEALFRSLGITDEKSIATAQLADRALPDLLAMIQRNAAEIRREFSETIDSLITHMSTSGNISEREITNMTQKMNNYAESFLGDYEHRTYEAYSLDGLDELIAMHHDLNVDPNTGELTIHAKAAAAQKFIADTEQRLGGRNAEFYKQTEEARNIVRRASRLDSLRKYKQAKVLASHPSLRGGELDEKVILEMNDEIQKLIDDVREMRTADRGIYKRFNYIPGAKRRKLDERIEIDREYMNFLGRVTDPLMNALYSIDQQKKVIEKLYFNRELGEHIISSGMGSIRGDVVASPVGEGTIQEISTLEGGTFLQYVQVYPDFQKEINAEYRINSKVRDSVLGGVIDVWKANNTIYSLRLGINNYVGNFSMLLASGHLWRFANIFQAGQITKRQFLERFTTNVNGLDATAQELYEEMRQARVVGGTMSEMNVMAYGRGVHEKVIGFFLKHLRDANALSSEGKFVAETWVNTFLEKMKTFYAFGDEWVKPLMYLNNRANAIAKWESKLDPSAPEFGGNIDEWRKEVRRRAIEEAAEQTVRESVSWENSPQFVRWLSQKNLRIFTPDFLMHNFQMLRITASNFLRLGECFRELNNLEVNNERDANYKDALVKEIAQRGVGGAMTTAVYAGLMGATGSVMALVPYMVNVLFNNIEGDGGDDDKKGMFFGPDEWEGAQRLMNYKTGGNNLFVPVFKAGDKIYAWNYVRSSVMLTHAPVRPPTDDPTFVDWAAVLMRNTVDLQNGTMTQQLINNMMGKDRFGREIGVVEGWARVLERTLVPGFARQLAGVTLGYPPSDNMFHEGRLIKVPDLLGITVNAYDPRDVANHLAYDINSHNTDRNIHRRNFVEQLSKSDRLSDRQIVTMITDMRDRNAKDLAKANYVVTGLRQVGMTDQEIVHWLTHNRKTGGDALPRKHAVGLLKGKDIYDEALITTLVNKRNQLNEGPQNLRMSKEELAVVSANLDKAIRMYKQALRAQ